MVAWTMFDAAAAQVGKDYFSPPATQSFSIALCSTVVDRTMLAAEITSLELLQELGYQRQAYVPEVGTFSASQKLYKVPVEICSFNATAGNNLQWQASIIWCRGGVVSSQVITSINPANNQISIPGHGRVNGDPVAFTAVDTLFGGVSPNTLYYTKVLDANSIEIHANTALTSVVDILNTGVGIQNLRVATGYPLGFSNHPEPQVIPGNSSVDVQVYWNWGSLGSGNGQ